MIRRPPRSTRTDTLFPYTTLFRSDRLSEGLALHGIFKRIFKHAINSAEALCANHDPLIVERRQHHVPGIAGFAENVFIGHEDIFVMYLAGPHSAHTELGQERGGNARRFRIDEEERETLVFLFNIDRNSTRLNSSH